MVCTGSRQRTPLPVKPVVSPQEKIILDYTEIHWHDSVIRKVVELPAEEKLLIEVDYPVDWENQKWEPHIIEFANLHTYEIHEGPFAGSPTILDATKSDIDKYGNSTFRLETNAGFRIVKCKEISIIKGKFRG